MNAQQLCVAAKPLHAASNCSAPARSLRGDLRAGAHYSRARALVSRARSHAQQRCALQVRAEEVKVSQDALDKTALLAELKALQEENNALKVEARSALGKLHSLGGTDMETLEILTKDLRSIEDLAGDIEWASSEDEEPFWQRSARKASALPLMLPPVPPVPADANPMHIVHISAELAPIAKVGGLGDAVAGLGLACAQRGHNVECIIPFYSCIDQTQIQNLQHERDLQSFFKDGMVSSKVYRGQVGGLNVILIQPDSHMFQGGAIYGGGYNELEAYLFFSRAALEFLQTSGRKPQVIHYHDWHTAAVPVLYWDLYNNLGLGASKVCLTIHNMDNTGECKVEELEWTGLPGEEYKVDERLMDPRTKGHNPERLSLLKGGIVYANAVTTVSPTYCNEILSGGASGWMRETLEFHKAKFHGFLNGIDRTVWDPERDAALPAQYSALNPAPKSLCKKYVLRGLGMPADEAGMKTPLVACVSRLVPQKGIHLIKRAIYRTAEKGGAFLLLGSAPQAGITHEFEQLAEELKDNPKIKLMLMYNENLSHHVYAACDIILVPSMFEPCGLTQMVGLQYGAVPVVRRTGGLADTVFDVDHAEEEERKNGFVFDGTDEGSLDGALDRALDYYTSDPTFWAELTKKNMAVDNSWAKSAAAYVDMYRTM
eukprot:CAMPEP_0118922034 /NCGR_PEP_ID=MMETSP1169-20130426/1105_1 /TAXON_ID=36882 /ORGANISM="Pyramimonas obovata, Strain CCMP722" /LENGTH=657 /DNA_ID=CAMNT_0006862847 /DNA_START=43 /DNA_END=2016 /DNA_ORIENTATION=+